MNQESQCVHAGECQFIQINIYSRTELRQSATPKWKCKLLPKNPEKQS